VPPDCQIRAQDILYQATFDREHLGGALGKVNQLAITAERGMEMAMQHTKPRAALTRIRPLAADSLM